MYGMVMVMAMVMDMGMDMDMGMGKWRWHGMIWYGMAWYASHDICYESNTNATHHVLCTVNYVLRSIYYAPCTVLHDS